MGVGENWILAELFDRAYALAGSPELERLSLASGVKLRTITGWRARTRKPDPDHLQQVLLALGFALAVERIGEGLLSNDPRPDPPSGG